MKKLILGFGLLLTSTVFADITIVQSPIVGKAINGPNGLLQVMEPTLEVTGYNGNRPLNADEDTAKAACSILGKTFFAMRSGSYSFEVVYFDATGVLDIKEGTSYERKRISLLACQ